MSSAVVRGLSRVSQGVRGFEVRVPVASLCVKRRVSEFSASRDGVSRGNRSHLFTGRGVQSARGISGLLEGVKGIVKGIEKSLNRDHEPLTVDGAVSNQLAGLNDSLPEGTYAYLVHESTSIYFSERDPSTSIVTIADPQEEGVEQRPKVKPLSFFDTLISGKSNTVKCPLPDGGFNVRGYRLVISTTPPHANKFDRVELRPGEKVVMVRLDNVVSLKKIKAAKIHKLAEGLLREVSGNE